MLVRVVELRPLPILKKRERDRRFAVPRCWEQREFEPPVLFGFSSPEKEAKSGCCRRFC